MKLNLVSLGRDLRLFDQALELSLIEVAHTNGLGLASLVGFVNHGLPRL